MVDETKGASVTHVDNNQQVSRSDSLVLVYLIIQSRKCLSVCLSLLCSLCMATVLSGSA